MDGDDVPADGLERVDCGAREGALLLFALDGVFYFVFQGKVVLGALPAFGQAVVVLVNALVFEIFNGFHRNRFLVDYDEGFYGAGDNRAVVYVRAHMSRFCFIALILLNNRASHASHFREFRNLRARPVLLEAVRVLPVLQAAPEAGGHRRICKGLRGRGRIARARGRPRKNRHDVLGRRNPVLALGGRN